MSRKFYSKKEVTGRPEMVEKQQLWQPISLGALVDAHFIMINKRQMPTSPKSMYIAFSKTESPEASKIEIRNATKKKILHLD